MSLTSHLDDKDSPVRRFIRETFPNTRPPLADCREAMRASPPILGEGLSRDAYSPIGTAIDYRIRYHFAVTPTRELVAFKGALLVAGRPHPPREEWSIPERFQLTKACVDGFRKTLDLTVNEIAADKRRPKDAEERRLARFCLVLAAFEAVFRAGVWPPKYFGESLPETAEELLELVPDEWAEDAAALAAAFAESYPSWHGAGAVLNPNFAGSADVGGADGDLIADGCLWEIKTTKERGLKGVVLHQLLGYLLLDYEGKYAIDRVGVLLPRQNTRVSWPIGKLIAAMSGRDDLELADLRERFRAICEGVREEERRLQERIEMLEERLAEEEERRLQERIEMLEERLAAEQAAAVDRRNAPD